jgi:predicted ester cyclase
MGTEGCQLAEQEIKNLAVYVCDQVFNHRNHKVIEEYFADDLISHFPTLEAQHGRGVFMDLAEDLHRAMPDYRGEILETLTEGDRGFLRARLTGTQDGTLMGIPGTGLPIDFNEMWFFRYADGKIVEMWQQGDYLGFMKQIGVMPPLGGGAVRQAAYPFTVMAHFVALKLRPKTRQRAAAGAR